MNNAKKYNYFDINISLHIVNNY